MTLRCVEVPAGIRDDLVRAAGWAARHAAGWLAELPRQGALLVRGLPLGTPADVAVLRDRMLGAPVHPGEAFAGREHLTGGVYSTIRWPADRVLCPYHEESYTTVPPGVVLLACLAAPADGGETLLSDARQVLAALPAGLVARFRRHGWRMTRTFHDRFGISWQDAFGTADRDELSVRLARDGITARWEPDGTLHTIRLRAAVVAHPVTGDECWFNQSGFLNAWGLDPAEREIMLATFGPGRLPVDTSCGDGSPLTPADVETIEAAYGQTAVGHRWVPGDLLLVDNVTMANGRRPYAGRRRVVVAFGVPRRLPTGSIRA
jgi:alpha-ketoglutarate-dependent taurine dioxygenase